MGWIRQGSIGTLAALAWLATAGGSAPAAAAGAAIPRSTCLPERLAESQAWPVRAIYLHGWFAPAGDEDVAGNRAVEFANRAYLDGLARRYHVRIAVPLGPVVDPGNGMLEWGRAGLDEIERSSREACRVAALPEGLALIGFSNGGFKARDIGSLPCGDLRRYSRILAVGTETRFPDRCNGKFWTIPEHRFPPDDLELLLGFRLPRTR